MERRSFDIINWKIENFSCWNQALHDKCITTRKILFCDREIRMKLYPKGTSGLETHMVVHFSIHNQCEDLSGDLLFIGSDGSTLCSQQVQCSTNDRDFNFELSPGLQFEEVIPKPNKIQSDHTDHFTLRLLVKSDVNEVNHIFTKIDANEFCMELRPNVIGCNFTACIKYIHDDHDKEVCLKITGFYDDEKLELCLSDRISDEFPYSVKTHLSLMSNVGSFIRCENNEHLFKEEYEIWTFSDSLTKTELSENVEFMILRLKIISGKVSFSRRNVYYSECPEFKVIPGIPNYGTNNVRLLSEDLMSQGFSDLKIKCGSATFSVHKSILREKSPVLHTKLSRVSASGIVEIEDVDVATLSRFLSFIYTGTVGEDLTGDVAIKLYRAAEKYQVPSLKNECRNFLIANVSVSNVCDLLMLGSELEDDGLVSAADEFVLKNHKEFLNSKEWPDFKRCESSLAVKTRSLLLAKIVMGEYALTSF